MKHIMKEPQDRDKFKGTWTFVLPTELKKDSFGEMIVESEEVLYEVVDQYHRIADPATIELKEKNGGWEAWFNPSVGDPSLFDMQELVGKGKTPAWALEDCRKIVEGKLKCRVDICWEE